MRSDLDGAGEERVVERVRGVAAIASRVSDDWDLYALEIVDQ